MANGENCIHVEPSFAKMSHFRFAMVNRVLNWWYDHSHADNEDAQGF